MIHTTIRSSFFQHFATRKIADRDTANATEKSVGAPSQNRSIVMPRRKPSDDVDCKTTTIVADVSSRTDKCH